MFLGPWSCAAMILAMQMWVRTICHYARSRHRARKTTWLFQRFPRLQDFILFAFLHGNICTCRVPLQSPRSYSTSERTFNREYARHEFSCLRLRRKKNESYQLIILELVLNILRILSFLQLDFLTTWYIFSYQESLIKNLISKMFKSNILYFFFSTWAKRKREI